MQVDSHLPLEELKRLERIEKDVDRARRMRIVILGMEGWTAPAVAMAVGLSRRICQRWVARYNRDGLAGWTTVGATSRNFPFRPSKSRRSASVWSLGPTRRIRSAHYGAAVPDA